MVDALWLPGAPGHHGRPPFRRMFDVLCSSSFPLRLQDPPFLKQSCDFRAILLVSRISPTLVRNMISRSSRLVRRWCCSRCIRYTNLFQEHRCCASTSTGPSSRGVLLRPGRPVGIARIRKYKTKTKQYGEVCLIRLVRALFSASILPLQAQTHIHSIQHKCKLNLPVPTQHLRNTKLVRGRYGTMGYGGVA